MLDREEYNAYMRQYVDVKYKHRMAEAIEFLGGKCARCGGTENLEIDHIDPQIKSFTVSSKAAGISEDKWRQELQKCQILCALCHKGKTLAEQGHAVRFRGQDYPSKNAAVRETEVGWKTFYREYNASLAKLDTASDP